MRSHTAGPNQVGTTEPVHKKGESSVIAVIAVSPFAANTVAKTMLPARCGTKGRASVHAPRRAPVTVSGAVPSAVWPLDQLGFGTRRGRRRARREFFRRSRPLAEFAPVAISNLLTSEYPFLRRLQPVLGDPGDVAPGPMTINRHNERRAPLVIRHDMRHPYLFRICSINHSGP